MCLHIIHFLLTVNVNKMRVQTHFLLLFVNKKYPVTYILLWKGGWFWLFTHFAAIKSPRLRLGLFIAAKCVKSQNHPLFHTIKSKSTHSEWQGHLLKCTLCVTIMTIVSLETGWLLTPLYWNMLNKCFKLLKNADVNF